MSGTYVVRFVMIRSTNSLVLNTISGVQLSSKFYPSKVSHEPLRQVKLCRAISNYNYFQNCLSTANWLEPLWIYFCSFFFLLKDFPKLSHAWYICLPIGQILLMTTLRCILGLSIRFISGFSSHSHWSGLSHSHY